MQHTLAAEQPLGVQKGATHGQETCQQRTLASPMPATSSKNTSSSLSVTCTEKEISERLECDQNAGRRH